MRIRPDFRRTHQKRMLPQAENLSAAPRLSIEELLAKPGQREPASVSSPILEIPFDSTPHDEISGSWLNRFTRNLRKRSGLFVSLALHLFFGMTLTVVAVDQLPRNRSVDFTVTPGGEENGAGQGDSFSLAGGGVPDGDNQAAAPANQESSESAKLFATPDEIRNAMRGLVIGKPSADSSIMTGEGLGRLRGSGGGAGSRGTGGGSGGGRFGGGGTGVGFFGAAAEARSCVYVVDMSGSMQGRRFRRALDELNRSIADLRPAQRFFVIMFSDNAVPLFTNSSAFDLLEVPRLELLPATPANKQKTQAWLRKLRADGETHPSTALKMALDLHPDVVFFLTDGEIPEGVPSDVSAYNMRHVPVHAIEFEQSDGELRLRRLASQNFGTYRHIR